MSNTRHLTGKPAITGDCGLGYCLTCITEYIQQPDPASMPNFAITMTPTAVPIAGPGGQIAGIGVVTVPACYQHINPQAAPQQQRRPLLVASSGLPQ